jgi:predicted Zn-ribbon and HTH transcriptional regulator
VTPPPAEEHPAERRHRECVAPEDTALYTCSCGFVFQAPVTTSVACPHCGSGQAW